MIPLMRIKKDIQFISQMSEIISSMRGVAIAHFHQHFNRKEPHLDEFWQVLNDIISFLYVETSKHPFILPDTRLPTGIVAVTSDEGFLGEINSLVIDSALDQRKAGDEIIVIGEKGATLLEAQGEPYTFIKGISEDIKYLSATRLRNFITANFLRKRWGRVIIVYPHFVSFGLHETTTDVILPCKYLFHIENKSAVIMEPSTERVIDYVVRQWLANRLYDILQDARLSEWSARCLHLESSSEEIKGMSRNLTLRYFRNLHELNDKNIREIFAARAIKG